MRNMPVIFFPILFLISYVSFAEEISFKELISNNRVNLNKIELNMPKEQVREFMGNDHAETGNGIAPNPYKKEIIESGKKQYEVYYYLNRKYPPFTSIKLTQTVPVIFLDGEVIGWDWAKLRKIQNSE